MSLAVRIIPTLLYRGHTLVKGKQFQSWRSVGHVQQAVSIHASRGVDELICLDIGATPAGRGPDFELVKTLCEQSFTPITVGGGVRSVADVRRLLECGSDKVAIGTAFCDLPKMKIISETFGAQALVSSIDVSRRIHHGGEVCFECGTTSTSGGMNQVQWAMICGKFAGEILLTSIDREGTMEGYDLDLIRAVSEAVSIPVIAHGGCSGPDDMIAAIKAGASAVAAGALFQFTDHTPKSCAEYLAAHGVETRIPA